MKHTVALFALLAVAPLFAQNAQITGVVTDPSNGPVAGASVNITSLDTGVRRTVNTSAEGYYTAPLLPRGRYELTVEVAGFKTARNTSVTLDEGQALRLDIALELGQVTESVEVTAQAGLLSTETTSV